MKKLAVLSTVAFTMSLVVPAVVHATSGLGNCYTVRGTADARNQRISTERALHRLHEHIAHEMRNPAGKTIGPTSTHCIRNACEASAIVCHH
jgi:hypothetical protein